MFYRKEREFGIDNMFYLKMLKSRANVNLCHYQLPINERKLASTYLTAELHGSYKNIHILLIMSTL